MKKESVLIWIFLILIVNLVIVSSSFQLDNYSIEKEYGPNENIKGWLNISLQDELSSKRLEAGDDFSGGISLINFLKANLISYTCIPNNCESSYSSENPQSSKTFSLAKNQEKVYGFVLTQDTKKIDEISFNLTVTNSLSCSNPLEIDMLDDNSIEWKSKNISSDFSCVYDKETGCFNTNEELSEVAIGTTLSCEKINLTESEKFQLGAWIKKGNTIWYNGLLKMLLYDNYGTELASCNLPEPSVSGGLVSCNITYLNPQLKEHYVCIKADKETDYAIKTESVNSCGFHGNPPGMNLEKNDYYVFAKGSSFSSIGKFVFNQQEYEKQGNSGLLKDYVDNYLNRYNRNCTSTCVIPIRFKAYTDLSIIISGLNLRYSTGAGSSLTPQVNIYDVRKEAAKISSNFQILELSNSNITTPLDYNEYDLQLYLDGNELLPEQEKIQLIKVPIIRYVYPKTVAAGIPVKFIAGVESPSHANITSYRWSFGDGENETTNINYVSHAYNLVAEYSLTLKATDTNNLSSEKTFKIKAENPKENANLTIVDYRRRLDNLTSQFTSLSTWYANLIKKKVDLDMLEDELDKIERDYLNAGSSDDYVEIMKNLLDLEIPKSIKISSEISFPFFVNPDDIKLESLEKLGAGSYDSSKRENYQEAIAGWSSGLDLNLKFKYVSAEYDERIENLVSIYNFKIESEEEIPELYVIIEESDIAFKENQNEKKIDENTGLIFSEVNSKNIEFAISYVPVESLVIYLSPKFSDLEIEKLGECNFNGRCEKDLKENWKNCGNDCKPYGLVFLLLVIILFFVLIVYIVLTWWYKRKYENYLFKKRSDLFNIISFIENAEKQGLEEKEIKRKLKEAGWSYEQIGYAFTRIRGKEIMPFDFNSLFEKFRKMWH